MPDSSTQLLLAALGVLALLAVLLLVALLRTRGRARRELDEARAESAALRVQLDQIERVLAGPVQRTAVPVPVPEPEYTITELGRTDVAEQAPVGRPLFADLVLRETVVRVASVAHGVRRALSAENRNRIRFEVRREIRRARKQRRVDTRVAVREWEARQRAAVPEAAGTP